MTRETAYERLTKVFREVFNDDTLVIDDMTTARDIADWTSYKHIELIYAVEEEFSFEMSMKQATAMKNVGKLVDAILEYGE